MKYQQGYIRQDGIDWDSNPAPMTKKQVVSYLIAKGESEYYAEGLIKLAEEAHRCGNTAGVSMTAFLRLRVA